MGMESGKRQDIPTAHVTMDSPHWRQNLPRPLDKSTKRNVVFDPGKGKVSNVIT